MDQDDLFFAVKSPLVRRISHLPLVPALRIFDLEVERDEQAVRKKSASPVVGRLAANQREERDVSRALHRSFSMTVRLNLVPTQGRCRL